MSSESKPSHVHIPFHPLNETPKYEDSDRRINATPSSITPSPDFPVEFVSLELENPLPYKWICKLVSTTGRGRVHGTGFLLNIPGSAKCIILTARHNLKGATKTEITFPGRNTRTVISNHFKYIRDDNDLHDYAIIILNDHKSSTESCGFGFSAMITDRSLLEANLSVFGYPSIQTKIWGSGGRMLSLDKDSIHYLLPTSAGQSGSPVYLWYEGWWTVVAIHVSADQRAEWVVNNGVRISVSVIKQIVKWVGEYQYLGISLVFESHFLSQKKAEITCNEMYGDLEFVTEWNESAVFDLIPVRSFPEGSRLKYSSNQWVILCHGHEGTPLRSLCIDPYAIGGQISKYGNVLNKVMRTSHIGICNHLNQTTVLRRATELVTLSLDTHNGNPNIRSWGIKSVRFPDLELRVMKAESESDTASQTVFEDAHEMFTKMSIDITHTVAVGS